MNTVEINSLNSSSFVDNIEYALMIMVVCPPNAKDQPDHGIKYLRAGAVANTLCHGLGCIRLLGMPFFLERGF